VKYVDAGYVIGLSVLFLYSASLLVRRRRLERVLVARRGTAGECSPGDAGGTNGTGTDSSPR
jgi:hypothetical protein